VRSSPSPWPRLSVWTLLASNLLPLYGVLVHGWSVFPIMLLFWMENVVIGLMNVVRMLVAEPPAEPGAPASQGRKAFMIPFFCVHYGMFTLVHGIFVFALFAGPTFESVDGPGEVEDALGKAVLTWHLGLALFGLVASHLVSFFTNFLGRGEYKHYSLGRLLFQPYGRVVILHLTILGGGFLAMSLGSPTWALVVLVGIKIAVDLGAHLWVHRATAAGD
jgi:hypothetical protein